MLAPPTISIPLPSSNLSDTGSLSGQDPSAPLKFPHTRAQLASLARQYKVPEVFEGDPDGDDPRVDSALVGKVVTLLGNEREDELKSLLKETFGPIDEEDVSEISSTPMVTSTRHLSYALFLLLRELLYRDRGLQDACMRGVLP